MTNEEHPTGAIQNEQKARKRLAELASEFGTVVLVESFFGGAGILQPLVGLLAKNAFADVISRLLSEREVNRICTGAWHARFTIDRHLAAGHPPRDDKFFDQDETGRSLADEILEGALIKCKNEHEENKTRYIGNIVGNAAFGSYSAAMLNSILGIAERLTYRQFRLLAIHFQYKELGVALKIPAENLRETDAESQSLVWELQDLSSKAILIRGGTQLRTTQFGELAGKLMGLDAMPREELVDLIGRLGLKDGQP